ncbi:DUF3303 family protein [Amaricoccus sp.]|uniref:DUF3303 domain-containing protein n=1 Tax=Amaricoccus sp. TaxID=1872485 RepID=UPI001B4DC3C8|nr:DUF3303 family protein [Amaricoccus sp.]MBP7001505.1 DUF3303 family protein [Amaricoccus sp.]
MKYVLTWKKKRHGTTAEYEEGQRRVLELMRAWRRPDRVRIHEFVVRVGEPGGFVVFEAENLAAVHRETAAFAMLNFQIDPVIDVDDALAAVGAAIEWRDSVV